MGPVRGGTRTTMIFCAGVAAIAVMAGSALAHNASFKSRVTIHEQGAVYNGRVFSPLNACVRNRLVKVFHPQAGADIFVGSDRSAADGRWRVKAIGVTYYAKVKRKVLTPGNHRHVCLSDRSPTI
jgi:hypothetical protein